LCRLDDRFVVVGLVGIRLIVFVLLRVGVVEERLQFVICEDKLLLVFSNDIAEGVVKASAVVAGLDRR
jgi:hypothetical protein